MTSSDRQLANDIRDANILLLMLAREDARRDVKSAMLRWGVSSRFAQRLSRLGLLDVQKLASVPEPLFRLADTESLEAAMTLLEGQEPMEKVDLAQMAHMASGPLHTGT